MKNLFAILSGLIISIFVFNACGQKSVLESGSSEVPNHITWDSLLEKHVNNLGLVNYKEFGKDSVKLNSYLKELANNSPSQQWSTEDQLAYWINLYNAATIKLILKHYPIASIKDIGSSIQIPFINTPWQVEFINVDGENYDLDYIEHTIIRKEFDESRIHFALVCAAVSCPKLRNEAYIGDKLDQQLTDQAKSFLTDSFKNKVSSQQLIISKLFRWYGGDFKKKGTLIEYLNQYSTVKIDNDADIDYMDYHWELNEQQ